MARKVFDYKKVESKKIANDVNLVKLSSIYDNPCGGIEYAEVSDFILAVLENETRKSDDQERTLRNHEMSFAFDETNGTLIWDNDEYEIDSEKDIEKLKRIFGRLTDNQRRRLYLYFKDQMTFEEIACVEGVTYTTVFYSCKVALNLLKKHVHFLQEVSVKNWIELLNLPIFY